jgi:putative ABC transport system substrate-binding protein
MFKSSREAANALGVQFQLIELNATDPDFESAFRIMAKGRIGGFVTEASGVIALHRAKILEYAQTNRIPAIHSDQDWVEAGGLMSYGANRIDLYRRAAVYVDKILKGAKPGDLPMEQPRKFELVINLKVANQIGLPMPQRVLLKADRVIR